MSDRTLPDEVRSVLLEHSFEAPDSDDTIARTLADTIEIDRVAERPDPPWWRSGAVAVVAAAVVGVCTIGGAVVIAATHNGDSASSSSAAKSDAGAAAEGGSRIGDQSMGPAQRQPNVGGSAPASPAFPVPTDLSCAATPGGRTVIVFGVPVKLSGVTDQVASAQCSDAAGQRSAAQVYTVRTIGGRSTIEATVLRQSDAVSVESITGGSNRFTVRLIRLATASSSEVLEDRTFSTENNGASYTDVSIKVVAPACTASALKATVADDAADKRAVLRVTNDGNGACEVTGYPISLGAVKTLGPSSDSGLVPVVLLQPGHTASAVLGTGTRAVACAASDRVVSFGIRLPSRQSLTITPSSLPDCPGTVQPFQPGPG